MNKTTNYVIYLSHDCYVWANGKFGSLKKALVFKSEQDAKKTAKNWAYGEVVPYAWAVEDNRHTSALKAV